jgi:hypothetical protein
MQESAKSIALNQYLDQEVDSKSYAKGAEL